MCNFRTKGDPTGPCITYLNEFSNHNANFMHCALEFTFPFTICSNCVSEYIKLNELYANVTGKECRVQFIDKNNLIAVDLMLSKCVETWTRAFCDGKI